MAAEKAPDSIKSFNVGNLKMVVATYSTTNIDDNDYWTSNIKGIVDYDVQHSIDGPNDCTIDALTRANGRFTFSSEANATGRVVVWCAG